MKKLVTSFMLMLSLVLQANAQIQLKEILGQLYYRTGPTGIYKPITAIASVTTTGTASVSLDNVVRGYSAGSIPSGATFSNATTINTAQYNSDLPSGFYKISGSLDMPTTDTYFIVLTRDPSPLGIRRSELIFIYAGSELYRRGWSGGLKDPFYQVATRDLDWGDTRMAVSPFMTRLGVDNSGRIGQATNASAFQPFALKSELGTLTGLASVATSGAYSDLLGRPVNLSEFTNNLQFQTLSQVNSLINAAKYKIKFTGAGVSVSYIGKDSAVVEIPGGSGSGTPVTVDQTVSSTSTNAIGNSVMKQYVDAAISLVNTTILTIQQSLTSLLATVSDHTTSIATNVANIATNAINILNLKNVVAIKSAIITADSIRINFLLSSINDLQTQINAFSSTPKLAAPALSYVSSSTATITVSIGSSTSATAYPILVATNSSFSSPLTFSASASGNYIITGLAANTQYYIKAQATGSGVTASNYSAVLTVTTPANSTQLGAPTLTTGTVTANSIALSWTTPANATGFILRQSLSSNMASPTVIYTGSGTSFTATSLQGSTGYYYDIEATGGTGFSMSNPSVVVNATTLAPPMASVAYGDWDVTKYASNSVVISGTSTITVSNTGTSGNSYVVGNKGIPDGGTLTITVSTSSGAISGNLMIGSGTAFSTGTGSLVSLTKSAANQFVFNSSGTFDNTNKPTVAAANLYGFDLTGTQIKGWYSTDNGTTKTYVSTWVVSQGTALRPKLSINPGGSFVDIRTIGTLNAN